MFAKAPRPGSVKTRLVPALGREGAAGLHRRLVRHALSVAAAARAGGVELWCAPDELDPFLQACAREFGAALRRQADGDLGARMQAAFAAAFARGEALVLIGSDCPALTPAHLREMAAGVAAHDAVLIPAEDGGYVAIALSRPLPGLFEGIAWGGASVMAETRARLAAAQARWKELAPLWDVDRAEDYARLEREGLLAGVPC